MTIRVVCTKCHKNVGAPDEALGKRIRCPQCGQVVKVEKWHAKASGVDMAPEKPSRGAGKWIVGALAAAIVLGIGWAVFARRTGTDETPPSAVPSPTDAAPADGQPKPDAKSAGKSAATDRSSRTTGCSRRVVRSKTSVSRPSSRRADPAPDESRAGSA